MLYFDRMFLSLRARFEGDRRFAFRVASALIIAVGLLLYANSFGNRLFWDDQDGILNNVFIRDWANLPKFFSENLIAGSGLVSNYWRPLLLIIYATEWHLWGEAPFGYHLTSTFIHIWSAVLAYALLDRLFGRRWLALLASLVFLVHPLQTEAVTYVSGRGDPLAILLMLGSILLFLRHRAEGDPKSEDPIYWGALFLFLLSLLTKETAIALPALVVLCDWFANGRGKPLKAYVLEILKATWPFLVLLGGYVLLRLTVLNFNNITNLYGQETPFTENFHVRLFTFFRVMTIYAGLLFAPVTLYMERTVPVALSFWSWDVLAGALLCGGLLAAAVATWKRIPEVGFGIAWFFIRILPNTNLLVPNSALLYEHWLYSPLLGWFFAAFAAGAAGLAWLAGQRPAWSKTVRVAVCGGVAIFLVLLSVRTVLRNRDWHDPIVFYNQLLEHARPSYRVLNNLGMAYDEEKRYDEALPTYERAVAIDPENPVAYHNIGTMWKQRGDWGQAAAAFRTALAKDPNFLFSYRSLAATYLEENKIAEAREVMERLAGHMAPSAARGEVFRILSVLADRQGDGAAAAAFAARAGAEAPPSR